MCVQWNPEPFSSTWAAGGVVLSEADQLIVMSQQSLGDLSVTPRKRGNICSWSCVVGPPGGEGCGDSATVSHHRETLSKAGHRVPAMCPTHPLFLLSPSSHRGLQA